MIVDPKILLKEHTSGVIVKHEHPFHALPVFSNDVEISIPIMKKFVSPFYFGVNDIDHFMKNLNEIKDEIDPNIIQLLFGETNWRCRSAASYFSIIQDISYFEKNIGHLLLKSEVCFAGRSYCLALANYSKKSDSAIDYLQRYLDHYLYQTDLWFDQGIAMAALAYIGKNKGIDLIKPYYDIWLNFTKNKPNWLLNEYIQEFSFQMLNLERIKRESSANK